MRLFKILLFAVVSWAPLALEASFVPNVNMQRAARHSLSVNKPATDFFEGALLGNGGMGVVVTTRPDAVCFHFGHNNVWDIRITENHREKFGTFDEIFAKADLLPDSLPSIHHDKEFADYLSLTADNYRSPYPRPFPCGTVILGFDRRKVELLGHRLDISAGICEVSLLVDGEGRKLVIFTDMQSDNLYAALYDGKGNMVPSCFNRIHIIPDPSTPSEFPRHSVLSPNENTLGFSQVLPFSIDNPDIGKDHAFSLTLTTRQPLCKGKRTTTLGIKQDLAEMERFVTDDGRPFQMVVSLREGARSDVERNFDESPDAGFDMAALMARHLDNWDSYWAKSGVRLDDEELESIWYRNLYFFNCAVKPGVTCPGIFANWSLGDIGTAWHGDYHLNYNTQQPFWVTFSTNHLDKNLPYADLVDHLLPVSKKWAGEYYGMRGAFFPHSGYPVEMNTHPYPVPDWGWEVFETPWMVQGLYWHYLYSADRRFLRDRAFGPIKEAVMFLVDYISRPEAQGKRWNDDRLHIFPSVPPELYGLQPGFKFNHDTQIDIALTKFIFDAYLNSVDVLGLKREERDLVKQVKAIKDRLPDYPTFQSEQYGTIFTSVPGETDQIVYNVPASLTNVFPGEDYGIHSPDSIRRIIANTLSVHQNEGGNDIVFLPMQKARAGMLDLDVFKRQVNYATLPNGTVTDVLLQIGGRYNDLTDFNYMGRMGIWFENFALPAVINECLMQSYSGVINLFPNWDRNLAACFSTLRARGGFLVSAEISGGDIGEVTIHSEQGETCRIANPWPGKKPTVNGVDVRLFDGVADIWEFKTSPGMTYTLRQGS